MLLSCSHIDEDEQLIYVQQEAAQRVVLLEDFTGQRCVNCPKGTEIISELEDIYGDSFIPVGIYWEPKAVPNGLATETGKEYFSHWELDAQPIGIVNRHDPVNYTDWIKVVRDEIQRPANITMQAEAILNGDQIDITVTETSLQDAVSGNLQVWIIEDGIVATQAMPADWGGGFKQDYVHNHVFRTAVNGTWGNAISIDAGKTLTQNFHQTVDEQWDTTKLSVVAFVYNDNGVEQATKTEVTYTK